MSRYTILENPIAHPGVCKICGSPGGDGRKYIDMQWHIDFYGTVYMCTFCFEEACSVLGWMSPVNQETAQQQLDEIRIELERVKAENDSLLAIRDISDRLSAELSNVVALREANGEKSKRAVGRPKTS